MNDHIVDTERYARCENPHGNEKTVRCIQDDFVHYNYFIGPFPLLVATDDHRHDGYEKNTGQCSHEECVENQTISEVTIHLKVHQNKQDTGTRNCRCTGGWYAGDTLTKKIK